MQPTRLNTVGKSDEAWLTVANALVKPSRSFALANAVLLPRLSAIGPLFLELLDLCP